MNGVCVGGSGTVSSGTTGQLAYYASNGTTLTATSSLTLSPSGSLGVNNINVVGADPSYSASTNTAAIQAALNLGGLVTLANPGTYQINSTLIIPSNTNLTCGAGVTIKLANGSNANMLKNANYGSPAVSVSSLTSTDGMVATTTTGTAHGLSVGDYVFITGAQSKITQAGTTTIQSTPNRITGLGSTQGMYVGDPIYGTGIPAGSFIINIVNGTSVDISQKLSGGAVNTTVTTIDNTMEPYNGVYKVTSVPSSTQFTYRFADTAPNEPFPTVAAGTITMYKADHDITTSGCTWDYNMSNQTNADQLSANLFNIRRVANLKILHTNMFNIGLYGAGIYNIYGGLVEDLYGTGSDLVVQGGSRNLVQLTGSGRDVTFRNIRGRFNDNLAAVVQGDYPQHKDSGFVQGNFDNIVVDTIISDRALTAFNYITQQGYLNGNVTVRNVTGSFSGGAGFINTGGDTGIGGPVGNIYRMSISGVENQQFSANPTIQLNGIFYASVSNSSAALGGSSNNTSNFITGGSDYSITTTDNQVTGTSTSASYMYPAGQIMFENHSNIHVTGIGNGILTGNNTNTPLGVKIDVQNWTGNASGSVLNIQANNTTANLSNIINDNFAANMINVASNVLGVVIRGQNINVAPAYQFTVGSGAGVEVNGATFGQDLGPYASSPPAWLTPTTGDLMKNINASGAGLYGYASSGTWANVLNPSIYNFGTNVAIGTTTPYAKLVVWGSDTASTTSFLVANSASTTVFAVYNNGNATYSGSIFQSSDRGLKTNITPLEASSSLAAILGLTPVSYTRLDQPEGGTNLGFLAQDVAQIFPELVSTTSPTALTPNGTLTLNYIGLIAPIVEAIKELAGHVGNLAKSITTQVITAVTGNFTRVNTSDLCLTDSSGSTCYTRSQLNSLLNSQSSQNTNSITITDSPSCTLSASPTSVTPGDHVVLSWNFPEAGTFSIDQNVGSVSPALAGTTTSKAINADTTFTGTAVSATGATVTCAASVSVTAPPPAPPLDLSTSTPPVVIDVATSTATSSPPSGADATSTDTTATSTLPV